MLANSACVSLASKASHSDAVFLDRIQRRAELRKHLNMVLPDLKFNSFHVATPVKILAAIVIVRSVFCSWNELVDAFQNPSAVIQFFPPLILLPASCVASRS